MTLKAFLLVLVALFASSFALSQTPDRIMPKGWHVVNPENYDAWLDLAVSHSGKGAGTIQSKPDASGDFGTLIQSVAAHNYIGKRVRFTAYVKSENVESWAGLWMRVDGANDWLASDNMNNRPIKGTTGWTKYEIVLEVPKGSVAVFFGVLLDGKGTVWIDDATLEEAAGARSTDIPENLPPASIVGVIRGPDGKTLAGSKVAAISERSGGAATLVTTSDGGRFELKGLTPDKYAITVTAPALEAGYLEPQTVESGKTLEVPDLTLKTGGVNVSGTVRNVDGRPLGGAQVLAIRFSDVEGDEFYTQADGDGAYSLTLPAQYKYSVLARAKGYDEGRQDYDGSPGTSVDFKLAPQAQPPASAAVLEWIREQAIRLKTPEAEHGFADMEPLRKVVDDAHLVCLGEATHGTREFFQLKHRMLEFLVEKMGFTVFGIEATFPESFDVNKYVLTGEGDAAKALEGLYFWTWNTQEVLNMILWMRKYNEDPAHTKKVKFYGFDMQFPQNAAKVTVDYLRKVDPEEADSVQKTFESFQKKMRLEEFMEVKKDHPDLDTRIKEVIARFDEKKSEYIGKSSADEWDIVRWHARIVQQYYEMIGTTGVRDRSMAENIQWILNHEGPGTKMVVSAHNGHVSTRFDDESGRHPVGWYLRKELGKDMVVFGFSFNEGSFRAMNFGPGRGGLIPFTVPPAPQGSLDNTLARAGLNLASLDLRKAPAAGPVADWFAASHKTRHVGSMYNAATPLKYFDSTVITRDFDALLFVETTTAAVDVLAAQAPENKKTYPLEPVNLNFESL